MDKTELYRKLLSARYNFGDYKKENLAQLQRHFWRIGHFAWQSHHTMSQWVKLRGEFPTYSFVSL